MSLEIRLKGFKVKIFEYTLMIICGSQFVKRKREQKVNTSSIAGCCVRISEYSDRDIYQENYKKFLAKLKLRILNHD